MKFSFNCSDCGHANHAVWSQVGKEIECFRCGKSLTVPAPMESISEPGAAPKPRRLKFRCPTCRRKFSTKLDLAGQKIRCTGCGSGVRVPWAEDANDMPSSEPAIPVFATSDDVAATPEAPERIDPVRADIPRLDFGRAAPKPANPPAPNVKAPPPVVKSPEIGAIAAIDASALKRRAEPVLSSRAEMIESVRNCAAEQSVIDDDLVLPKDPTRDYKKKKKKKKQSSFFDPKETLKLVAGVGAVVVALGIAAVAFPEFRLPLGGVLCLVGFIVYVLGAISLRQLVAEEGFIKLMLFRFFPPYQWWFIFSNWKETRDYFAFFMAGAMVMSLGGAIIKISPLSVKAEADERAYMQRFERRQAEFRPAAPAGIVEADDDEDD